VFLDNPRCEAIAADSRVVGIVETGLDYHYDHSPRPTQ
jgi:Tat protein secretion system quality control protein TatD with DNase activity